MSRALAALVLALVLAACGSPFASSLDGDAGPRLEGGGGRPDRGELPGLDGAGLDGAGDDVGDAAAVGDARGGATDAEDGSSSKRDAAPPSEDAGCVLAAPEPTICDGVTAATYCLQIGGDTYATAPTPPACQCASSYDCACVEALPDPCDGRGTFLGCFMESGLVPVVECASS